jgi:hypothetical protein
MIAAVLDRVPVSPAPDLFALGQAAAAVARAATGGRGVFARARRLLGTGAWRGPRDAADAYVEEEDLAALGGLGAAIAAGARTLIATPGGVSVPGEERARLRCLWRLPYRAGEPEPAREARLAAVAAQHAVVLDGVLPTPEGEALGLDTLHFVALCRLRLPVPHVVVDFARLGHRLAQMCLAFGADELFGPIVAERALRLGDNSGNPAATRKEAATLIRGAGLIPAERISGGAVIPCEEPVP